MDSTTFSQVGWPFFPVITEKGASIENLTYDQDIAESLGILFTTLPGERLAHPLYGCDLMQYMFKPINNSLLTEMESSIKTAITLYEPRIKVVELNVTRHGERAHRIDIFLSYILTRTNSRFNMTIPFYIMETGIE